MRPIYILRQSAAGDSARAAPAESFCLTSMPQTDLVMSQALVHQRNALFSQTVLAQMQFKQRRCQCHSHSHIQQPTAKLVLAAQRGTSVAYWFCCFAEESSVGNFKLTTCCFVFSLLFYGKKLLVHVQLSSAELRICLLARILFARFFYIQLCSGFLRNSGFVGSSFFFSSFNSSHSFPMCVPSFQNVCISTIQLRDLLHS